MRRSENGFTLVELLVAFAAASLLVVGLSVFVSSLAREAVPDAVDARLDELLIGGPAFETLVEGSAGRLIGTAGSTEVRFQGRPPLALRADGLDEIAVRTNGRAPDVRLEIAFENSGGAAANADVPIVLTRGWDDIRIETDADDTSEGFSEIRVIFEGHGLDGLFWAARPKVSPSTEACEFDPISMACRA